MKQQTVGYEVRVYARGYLHAIEMFRDVVDARTWAEMRQRQSGQVAITLYAIGRNEDGTLYHMANLAR